MKCQRNLCCILVSVTMGQIIACETSKPSDILATSTFVIFFWFQLFHHTPYLFYVKFGEGYIYCLLINKCSVILTVT